MKRNKNNKFVRDQPIDSGSSSGVPRRFERNSRRMGTFNKAKSTGQAPREEGEDTRPTTSRSVRVVRPRPPARPRVKDEPVKSSVPVPPSTLTTYDGQSVGLQPVHYINSHNMDFSSFPIISRELHRMLVVKESTFKRSMPYCMFQHYLSVILNATLIKRVKSQNVENRFMDEQDPFDVIHAEDLWIPTPFLQYINGIGSNILHTGDKVYLNLPVGGTPRRTFNIGDIQIPSGTFGVCNRQHHNSYECYVSPYVTRSLIDRTKLVYRQQAQPGAWVPLPPQLFPIGARATPNLLGYELPETIEGETFNILDRFEFTSDNSMAGRLSLSSDLMNTVSGLLRERTEHFSFSRGVPIDPPINPAAFIYNRVDIQVPSIDRLASEHGLLFSCEIAGASAANMSSYFGFKRIRTDLAPGPCFVAPNGNNYVGWTDTMNSNASMVDPFLPTYGQDFQFLRMPRFIEEAMTGSREASIRLWLDRDFALRK